MGSSVSTDVKSQETIYKAENYSSCGANSSSQVIKITGLTVEPPAGCDSSKVNISQAAVLDTDCYINTAIAQTAELAQNLSKDAKTGLGLRVDTDVNETKVDIKNIVENTCKDTVGSQEIEMTQVKLSACDIYVTQTADANAQCRIDTIQNFANKVDTETKKVEEGGSLLGFLGLGSVGSAILLSVVGLIVLVVVIVIVFKMVKGSKKPAYPPMPGMGSDAPYNFGAETSTGFGADTGFGPAPEGGLSAFAGGFMKKIFGGKGDSEDCGIGALMVASVIFLAVALTALIIILLDEWLVQRKIMKQNQAFYEDAVMKKGCLPQAPGFCSYPAKVINFTPTSRYETLQTPALEASVPVPAPVPAPSVQVPAPSTTAVGPPPRAPAPTPAAAPAADYVHHFINHPTTKKSHEGFRSFDGYEACLDDYYRSPY